MTTWEDAEGHTRSSLNVVQRMSIPYFLNRLPLSGNKIKIKVRSNAF
jgi:hypothetical protein